MSRRKKIEKEKIAENTAAITTQLAVQQATIDQKRALVQLKHKNLEALKVRAGINCVTQEAPQPVQVGQRVTQGTIFAKVVDPTHLNPHFQIPETTTTHAPTCHVS